MQLVVGPWGDSSVPDGVTPLAGLRSLVPVLRQADLVVTAGGLTLLEALRIGRPCVTFAVAPNQQPNVDAVGRAGAAWVVDPADAAQGACTLVDDARLRGALARAGATLVDGHGATRVAEAIAILAAPRVPGDQHAAVGAAR